MKLWTRRPDLLAGVRLLVLGDATANLCGKLLADLGAERVASPVPFDSSGLKRILSRTDVFLQAGPPGVLEGLGFEREGLCDAHPRLILVSVTPFGDAGPRRDWSFCDLVAAAAGGQLYVTGEEGKEPLSLPGRQALSIGALHAAVGTVLALLQRDATGSCARVEISLQESVASALDHVLVRHFSTGDVPGRSGSRHWNQESTVLPCRDGHMLLYLFQQWDTVVGWMDAEGMAGDLADPVFRDPAQRRARFDHVRETVSRWTALHTRAELFETAQLMRLPWAPVCTPAEVLASPQLAARDFFHRAEGAEEGEAEPPYRFSIPDEAGWPKGAARGHGGGGPDKPLTGIRVLDFTRVLAGPFATRILADFGAEVIKVQSRKTAGGADVDDQPYFATWNRNKLSVTIDMDRPESRDVVLELARSCDVVVENFSPRVLDNWDLGYAVLRRANPNIVLLRMSGAGQDGPWRDLVAYGPTIHALGGFTSLTAYPGGPPLGPGFAYSDVVAGLYGALAVAASLYARSRTGRGCSIDLSQYEAAVGLLYPALRASLGGAGRCSRLGIEEEGSVAAPYGCFPCQGEDRWCALAVFCDEQWTALCEVLGLAGEGADPRFATREARTRHFAELRAVVEARTASFWADDLARLLQDRGVPAAPVADARDLARDPQLQERGFFTRLVHPRLGEITADRGGIRLGGDTPSPRPAPLLGQDNEKVFAQLLGWSSSKIEELRARGVIA